MSNLSIIPKKPSSVSTWEAMTKKAEKKAEQVGNERPSAEPNQDPVYVLNISNEAKALSANILKETATQTTIEQLKASTSTSGATAIKAIEMTTKGGNSFVFRTVTNKAGNVFLLADVTTNKDNTFTVMVDSNTLIKENEAGELRFMSLEAFGTEGDDIIVDFSGLVDSKGGDDFILEMAPSKSIIMGREKGDVGIVTGEGNDTVYIAGKRLGSVGIHTGAGNDAVTIMDEADHVIIGTGEGNDSVKISKMTTGTIKTGAGDDFVQVDEIGRESLEHLDKVALPESFIVTGDGDDSVLIGNAYSTLVDTGDGINRVHVTGDVVHSGFKTGNGKSEITIEGDAIASEFNLQSNNDQVSIAGVAKNLLFKLAGEGTQVLIFNNKLLENVSVMKALQGAQGN